MKKTAVTFAIIVAVIGVAALNWGSVHALLVSRPDFASQHVEPVVMVAMVVVALAMTTAGPLTWVQR